MGVVLKFSGNVQGQVMPRSFCVSICKPERSSFKPETQGHQNRKVRKPRADEVAREKVEGNDLIREKKGMRTR